MTARDVPDVVLRTVGLAKRYGRINAVSDLDLAVPRGRVYGFLGPNGAGKSTTIAMMLGLIAPTAGHVEMFGMDTRQHRREALARTGSILEGQAYYPLLSARDNMKIWAAMYRHVTPNRISEVLDQVGLGARQHDKVHTFSLGMKQRLGLASALMHDPELLVLDEPTNGLDPAGIREFRQLIRELAAQGKTVFVSSHLLGEVQVMCDDVGIVKQGRLITQGPVAELTHEAEGLEMRVTDPVRAVPLLQADESVRGVAVLDGRVSVEVSQDRAAHLSKLLADNGIYLSELRPRDTSLEDFFLEVTGGDET